MMTLPTSASSSSSLHLLPSRSPLTVEASSAKPDILPFVLQAVMTDPIIAGMVTSTHQQDAGFEASPRRTKRPRQVRFDNKISGKKLAPFAAEVRSSMYYNVSYPINTNTPIRQKLKSLRATLKTSGLTTDTLKGIFSCFCTLCSHFVLSHSH